MAGSDEGIVGGIRDWVDIAQKVVIGVCAAAVTSYFVARKEELTGDKICVDIQSAAIDTVRANGSTLEEIQARVDLVPARCVIDREKFLRLLSELASRKRESRIEVAAATEVCRVEKCGDNVKREPPASEKGASGMLPAPTSEGWVAYGYRNPTAYSETNFDVVTRMSSAAGEAPDVPSKGTILKSRWQVNLRRTAADWTNPVAVVAIGQCLRVEEGRVLPAGTRQQIWLRTASVDCP